MSQKPKRKLSEAKEYLEYNKAVATFRKAQEVAILAIQKSPQLLLGQSTEESDIALPPDVMAELSRLEEIVLAKEKTCSSFIQKIYDDWLEELKTSDVSEPGVHSYKSLMEAEQSVNEHRMSLYYEKEEDVSKQAELKSQYDKEQIELLTEAKRRRDILNIIFDTHIIEW